MQCSQEIDSYGTGNGSSRLLFSGKGDLDRMIGFELVCRQLVFGNVRLHLVFVLDKGNGLFGRNHAHFAETRIP